jgi:hypothetical protein
MLGYVALCKENTVTWPQHEENSINPSTDVRVAEDKIKMKIGYKAFQRSRTI